MSDWPKISIITPSYNQAPYLEETLRSVLDQGYPNLEYLVIDGGSTDGSVEILERYSPRLSYWISEQDRGQSHALNKGLAHATGEIIAYLNSDDPYLPGALLAAGSFFRRYPHRRWCCGHTMVFGGAEVAPSHRPTRPPRHAAAVAYLDFHAPQPGHFWHRSLFERYGEFDEGLRYCFDHDFYLRSLLGGEKCYLLDYPVAAYRLHDASKTCAETEPMRREVEGLCHRYQRQIPAIYHRWETARLAVMRAVVHRRAGRWAPALREAAVACAHCPPSAFMWIGRGCVGQVRQLLGRTPSEARG